MSRTILQVDGVEVERHYIRFIEDELRRHPLRKIRVRTLEDDIIRASPNFEPGMPRGTDPGNPTMNRAVALMKDAELAHIRGMVAAVDEVLKLLSQDQREIVRHFYFEDRLKAAGIAEEMKMHIQSVYRERNRALVRFCYALIGTHTVREAVKNE